MLARFMVASLLTLTDASALSLPGDGSSLVKWFVDINAADAYWLSLPEVQLPPLNAEPHAITVGYVDPLTGRESAKLLTLMAESGHGYLLHVTTAPTDDSGFTVWITDLATGNVVAGHPPFLSAQ
jgi:hypothetical protein